MKRYCFIINPTASSGDCLKKFTRLEEMLIQRGIIYKASYSEHPGHARELAAAALDEGYDVVVGVGGDGTIHEISQVLAGTHCVLGILPFGTGNDFCKSLQIPTEPVAAMETVLDGKKLRIDAAQVNQMGFNNVAGFGFDVDVLKMTEHYKRTFRNSTAYMLGVIHALSHLKPYQVRVEADGNTFESSAFIMVVGNGRFIGGGMNALPTAELSDGLLDVCLIPALPFYRIPKVLLRFMKGKHKDLPDTVYFQAKEVKVECAPASSLQLDGEIIGQTPAHFQILPGALQVMVQKG